MKKLMVVALMLASMAASAGVPEVLAAEKEVAIAKAKVAALKKSLSKKEKAELAVALAQAKLAAVSE